ncbi:hypothetical protein EVB94_224 [Rhizobium phage RHph_TM40]|uniref:Uncharacterized protein n=2 Tax=Cuauhnahuacvirus TaxID=3044696 RepID=A0A7S5R7Z9_9CAUD|nr:hypothetical protein PQC17_gp224 [Rhizobium phage RHph_Y65]QIG71695.1 hypothetical protein EVB94_224 [Rhizobium phage RHph_TM40]QIG72058.1 hypothetical protein EVB95_224 [Rhizobium phage RHph_TM2_3B]QIG72420.1 hypothetical protein EVB96_224 [Rhizobium phage RHph_TM3_3_6]QIG72782.1 hypothetical protein EVB97_224 [Rhizobium phage RHph_Y65]
MTETSVKSLIDVMSDKVLELVVIYRQTKSSTDLKNLLDTTILLVKSVRIIILNLRNVSNEDFDQDVCLDFISMILTGRDIQNPTYKIKSIIEFRIRNNSRTYRLDDGDMDVLEDMESSDYVDNRLLIDEIIRRETEGLPDRVVVQILYYVSNPAYIKNYIKMAPECPEKYVIVLKTYYIRRKIMDDKSKELNITVSKDRVANLLLMSGLYNTSPPAFVLLSLMKDFKNLLQFLVLFEGQSIKIPTIEQINHIFSDSSHVSTAFENDTLTINNKEMLASLVTDTDLSQIDADTKLNRFIDEYLSELINVATKNYDVIQTRLLKNIDYTDTKRVSEAYKIINQEMTAQIKLMGEIVSTLSTIKDIRSAIEMIKSNKEDNSSNSV